MGRRETTVAFADQLRQYAEHFAQRDWNYTRDTGDLRLRYGSLWPHLKRALGYLVRGSQSFPDHPAMRPERLSMVRAAWSMRNSEPDGVLDNGNIITHWEETGEYLQYVQPSVGSMLADWMEAEPDNPHAQRIAAEMKRINDGYGERIREGEVGN
jgi:hypothetical protein